MSFSERSSMYKCLDCNRVFDEFDTKRTSYESYFGVSDLFPNSHNLTIEVCPRCGSENISEVNLCESCKWSHIDNDSEEYCETEESFECKYYEEF